MSLLKSDVPRQVSRDHVESVVMIMDACYEKDSGDRVCGFGGTVVDIIRGVSLFFSCGLDEDSVVCWEKRKSTKKIFEAESLCAVLAYNLWEEKFAGRKNLLYVNNEGTKFSLTEGKSDNLVVDAIAKVFVEIETHSRTLLDFEGAVPSRN